MTYTLILRNNSAVPAVAASLTDPIPAHTTYVPASVVASDGNTPTLIDREIHWSGQIVSGAPVIIEYVVEVQETEAMQKGDEITNLARLEDGLGNTMLLGANALYNPEAGLTIDDGALYTNIPTVTLTLWNLEGLPQMRISNSGGFGTGTGWIDTQTTTSWVLDTQDHPLAPRTVYAMFRGENGKQYGPARDDIVYDPVPPRVTQVAVVKDADSGLTEVEAEEAVVRVTATDDNSGVSKVEISDDPDFETYWEAAVVTETTYIPIPWEPVGSEEVFARAVDRAGNVSEVKGSGQYHALFLPLMIRSHP
jgi:uncharacterized repeat protein (TIGR01451 family)